MELIDIQDSKGFLESKEKICAVGIDFGTTNSLIAYSVDKKPFILKNNDNKDLTKSIFHIDGIELKSIKRLIGKSYNEINKKYLPNNYHEILVDDDDKIKLKINGKLYSPIEIVVQILKKIKNYGSFRLGEDVSACVLTVPAYFDENAKNEIKFAANLAGLEVLRLINEPSAAAYAYGLDDKAEGLYLVYDFGGGTFDVSLINMKMGVFKVIATNGDNLLGGDDIDISFRDYLAKTIKDISQEIAQQIKESLSEKTEIIIDNHTFYRKEFEESIEYIIDKTIEISSDLLRRSEIDKDKILGIILVGGSSKIPLVRKKLKERLNLNLFCEKNPETIVALGASLVAENLTYKNNNLILDIVPLSIGVEIYGGFVEKIIERNTHIPCSITKQYTTYADNQTAMKFHIVQGEREMAKDCRSIGFFELKNIPPMKAGLPKIDVIFKVDEDGLISIKAEERNSKQSNELIVKSTYGISQEDIDRMLKNAYVNAATDHHEKILLQAEMKGKDLIKSVNILLSECSHDLNENEINRIEESIRDLDLAIKDKNIQTIKDITKNLKDLSNFIVEMKLSNDILSVIKGKNIKDI